MTKSELNRHKSALASKQVELVQTLRNRDGIGIERCSDALDELQYATVREPAIRSRDRGSNLLRKVPAALDRIDAGSFGVCLHCDDDPSSKRLGAAPFTAFCIVCQEIADRSQYHGADSLDELLISAA
jgi:DnaK suppressor protein